MSDAEWIMKQQIEIKDKEIERLRELLKGVVDDMVIGEDWERLLSKIKSEVSDDLMIIHIKVEINRLREENEQLREENKKLMDGMESAWGLIANAQSVAGDGKVEHWQESMERWRDNDWHPALDRNGQPMKFKGGER